MNHFNFASNSEYDSDGTVIALTQQRKTTPKIHLPVESDCTDWHTTAKHIHNLKEHMERERI